MNLFARLTPRRSLIIGLFALTFRELRMRAARLDWAIEKGEWRERESDPQQCAIQSAADLATCRFETKEGGRYRVVASITDDRDRRNET